MASWVSWIKHSNDINDPLTSAELTGLTFAGTTLAVLNVVINVFIAYFYTNTVGLKATTVGTLLLITRVADGFSDLGMGIIIKKTQSKWGQARPWCLRMAAPLLVSVILTFYIPQYWDLTAKTLYACISYFLMINIAITPAGLVGSVLGTNMTVSPESRRKNALISTPIVLICSVVGNMVVLKITQSMNDSYEAWRIVAVMFGLLAFVGQLAQFLLTRERITKFYTTQKNLNNSINESLPALIKNKYFIIMCFVGMMTAVDSAMAGCSIFYLRYVLNKMELLGVMGIITLFFMLSGIALTPIIAKKIPVKHLILAGLAIKIATYAINFISPGNLALFLCFTALRSFVGAPLMLNSSVYLLNTIEYGEFKTGILANHLILSVSSVCSKIGSGFGGALIGWMLAFGGYDGLEAVQTTSARNMIIAIYFLIPLIVSAICFILLSRYKLDEKYQYIIDVINRRKESVKTIILS